LPGKSLRRSTDNILEELGRQPGMLGEIFKKARPDIQNPATLKRLIVDLIEPEQWMSMQADVKRDKLNLDIFWLKDKSLEDSENLPEPDVLAQEITDDLQTALEQFSAVAAELKSRA